MNRVLRTLAIVGLLTVGLTIGGCDLTELNKNPNAPSNAKPGELLTGAQQDLASTMWNDYPGGFWKRYAQYLTTNQYTDGDRYRYPNARSGANNGNWADLYFVLNDLQQIVRLNRQSPGQTSGFGPPQNQIAIAKIMQVWTYQWMTDIWGPIPFQEALKGRSQGNFTPSYTGQPKLYPALIDTLTKYSQAIQTDAPALTSGDLIYGGDMGKWKNFANALKMRLAMRMSDRMPDAAATAINEAVQAGAFESVDGSALIPFGSSSPYQNPLWAQYALEGRDDWAAPAAMVSVMNNNDDPRRRAFFSDADADSSGNQFNGFPYGLTQGDAQSLFTNPNKDFSRPGPRVRGRPTEPAILMLYDEVLFIKAEAKLRDDMSVPNITKSAEQLYRDAITASIDYWTGDITPAPTDAEVDNFLSQLDMPGSGNFSISQDLGVQKWLAQYQQGVQGWSTWRRLDFQGVLQVPPGNPGKAAFGRSIAVRMAYPQDESTFNSEKYKNAVNNMLGGDGGEDTQGTLLWWDTEYVPPRQ
ncbi:MAG: SusD/RagB family nutrient-binding outer membrane lipoprotein [Salinibacter sp.]|uniref:SusD/RagB family nutrient-binding outer membrane lipoprotein n=1 Tax=Salinibacter sp. TaxID=2065818 RepID=UPI0035D3EEB4